MNTIRGQNISDLANYLDTTHTLNAGQPISDLDRLGAIVMLTGRLGPANPRLRAVLMQLAIEAMAWLEAVDEAQACRVDSGDEEADAA